MIQANQIKPEMPVVCSTKNQFGVVDHMEGVDSIKLKKDSKGQHHYIPLSWVKSVDGKVHIDRPMAQALKEWTTSAPATEMEPAAGAAAAATPGTAPAAKT